MIPLQLCFLNNTIIYYFFSIFLCDHVAPPQIPPGPPYLPNFMFYLFLSKTIQKQIPKTRNTKSTKVPLSSFLYWQLLAMEWHGRCWRRLISCQVQVASWFGVGETLLARTCAGFVCAATVSVSSYVHRSCCVCQTYLLRVIHYLCLLQSSYLLFFIEPWVLRGGIW